MALGIMGYRKIDAYRTTTTTTTNGAAATNGAIDVITATPLETAEGSDELRFAVIAGAAIAGGIGIWWWMRSKDRKGRKGKRRKARGFLL